MAFFGQPEHVDAVAYGLHVVLSVLEPANGTEVSDGYIIFLLLLLLVVLIGATMQILPHIEY